MHPVADHHCQITRRSLFGRAATGVGTAALASLMARDGLAAEERKAVGGLPGLPHFAPKAKRIIYLFQNGAPTHVDLFDYKPKIADLHGKPVPESFIGGKRFSTMTGNATGKLMLSPIEPFKRRGKSGAWVSELLPHTAKIADQLTFVKGMYTEQVNHAPAITFLLTGGEQPGRPTLGAWMSSGLGSRDVIFAFPVANSMLDAAKWRTADDYSTVPTRDCPGG